jgi:signal transduction histidine kinase
VSGRIKATNSISLDPLIRTNRIMSSQPPMPKDDTTAASGTFKLDVTQIVDLLPCYITVQDRNFRILFSNRQFHTDFGDGAGRFCYSVYKGSGSVCPNCPVEKTFRDKSDHVKEETVQLSNGRICQILVQTTPILSNDGEVAAVIEMSTNITDIKKSQKELKTLGQSIALLSHSIKNILEGLEGGAYVVDEGFKDGDLPLAKKGWNIVSKNIIEITDVVKNILYSSKNRPLKYESVSPARLVKDSIALFKEKAAGFNIQLIEHINPDVPDVRLDIASVRQMLNNLIWNGLQACLNHKQKKRYAVKIKTDLRDNMHFLFEIADNGVGMDQHTQRNIFEEFFSTKGSAGTGLGLAVVEKVVNKHGGRIEINSAVGKGSRFTIILPINS